MGTVGHIGCCGIGRQRYGQVTTAGFAAAGVHRDTGLGVGALVGAVGNAVAIIVATRHLRIVTGVAHAITIGVGLRIVQHCRAVVVGIDRAVDVGVVVVTPVTSITDAIAIGIGLIRVGVSGAVIGAVVNAVGILVHAQFGVARCAGEVGAKAVVAAEHDGIHRARRQAAQAILLRVRRQLIIQARAIGGQAASEVVVVAGFAGVAHKIVIQVFLVAVPGVRAIVEFVRHGVAIGITGRARRRLPTRAWPEVVDGEDEVGLLVHVGRRYDSVEIHQRGQFFAAAQQLADLGWRIHVPGHGIVVHVHGGPARLNDALHLLTGWHHGITRGQARAPTPRTAMRRRLTVVQVAKAGDVIECLGIRSGRVACPADLGGRTAILQAGAGHHGIRRALSGCRRDGDLGQVFGVAVLQARLIRAGIVHRHVHVVPAVFGRVACLVETNAHHQVALVVARDMAGGGFIRRSEVHDIHHQRGLASGHVVTTAFDQLAIQGHGFAVVVLSQRPVNRHRLCFHWKRQGDLVGFKLALCRIIATTVVGQGRVGPGAKPCKHQSRCDDTHGAAVNRSRHLGRVSGCLGAICEQYALA